MSELCLGLSTNCKQMLKLFDLEVNISVSQSIRHFQPTQVNCSGHKNAPFLHTADSIGSVRNQPVANRTLQLGGWQQIDTG